MDIDWNGVVSDEGMSDAQLRLNRAFADASRDGDWGLVFLFVDKQCDMDNMTRLGGSTLYAPLHHAARLGAELDVVRRLIKRGALRTLRAANGEIPLDIARRYGHEHMYAELTPTIHHEVPEQALSELEASFHSLIRELFVEFRVRRTLRLPMLEPLLELKKPEMGFFVPEMWGGFLYRLKRAGAKPVLCSEYRNRMCDGANLRHEIWPGGSRLIKKGFR